MELRSLASQKDRIACTGLGLLMLLAGLTKFTMTYLWTGYEPALLVELIPVTATQLLYLGGAFETALGLGLLLQKYTKYFSIITFAWLFAITIQVSRLGLWDLAIRDLGLTFYALTVALNEWKK